LTTGVTITFSRRTLLHGVRRVETVKLAVLINFNHINTSIFFTHAYYSSVIRANASYYMG